jgi:hypothetical protein
LAVNVGLPVESVKELIALAKASGQTQFQVLRQRLDDPPCRRDVQEHG